jgi:adenosine kinase
MISPDEPHRMLNLAQHCIKNHINFIFDPGQCIPALSNEALLTIIESCTGVLVNSYEGSMLEKKLGGSLFDMSNRTGFLIKTIGPEGCELYVKGNQKIIPAIPDIEVVDTTGGGDGFRAGFLHGFTNTDSLERACEIGNTVASFVLTQRGTQNHKFTKDELQERLLLNYGEE